MVRVSRIVRRQDAKTAKVREFFERVANSRP